MCIYIYRERERDIMTVSVYTFIMCIYTYIYIYIYICTHIYMKGPFSHRPPITHGPARFPAPERIASGLRGKNIASGAAH